MESVSGPCKLERPTTLETVTHEYIYIVVSFAFVLFTCLKFLASFPDSVTWTTWPKDGPSMSITVQGSEEELSRGGFGSSNFTLVVSPAKVEASMIIFLAKRNKF